MLSKYLSHRFALFLLFFCFSSSASTNLLIFNRPADTPQARYVIDLMKMAYKEIGYEIHIIDFNHQNALVGEDLIEFVNNKLFPYLKGFRERAGRTDSIEYKIGAIFDEIDLHGKNLSNSDFSFGSFKASD